ncbi:MAG: TIGR03546 family protein [Elusimicrobiota bacterium]
MIWIKLIKKLFKALNANASPSEIALGVVLGSVIGLTPVFALHNIFVILLIIILKVNVSAAVFSSLLFSIAGLALDPAAHAIGSRLLLSEGLNAFWTTAYNIPVIPLTRFNNTIVLGSLVISVAAAVPLYLFSVRFVLIYRNSLHQKVEKLKIIKILKASKLYSIYTRFKS